MKTKSIKNEKGMATIETVLLLFIFVLFMSFTTGFYGVIHAGILNSISARAYAFEIIRNRANVTYFRNPTEETYAESMYKVGFRVHGVITPNAVGKNWVAQPVHISFPRDLATAPPPPSERPTKTSEGTRMKTGINPVYIKTAYGICLDTKCGET